jgi:uncharacterized membrane protein YeiH
VRVNGGTLAIEALMTPSVLSTINLDLDIEPTYFLRVIDLLATFAGALAGGLVATRRGVDIVGLAILGFVAGVGGGVLRDLLLGDQPPVAFRDYRYALVALAAAACVVLIPRSIVRATPLLQVLDAVGIGLFAAVGCVKATEFGAPVITVLLIGTVAAVGGGLLRDVLMAQVPVVLRTEVLASAAAIGCVAFVLVDLVAAVPVAAVAGGATAAVIRGVALLRGWSAPAARPVTDG